MENSKIKLNANDDQVNKFIAPKKFPSFTALLEDEGIDFDLVAQNDLDMLSQFTISDEYLESISFPSHDNIYEAGFQNNEVKYEQIDYNQNFNQNPNLNYEQSNPKINSNYENNYIESNKIQDFNNQNNLILDMGNTLNKLQFNEDFNNINSNQKDNKNVSENKILLQHLSTSYPTHIILSPLSYNHVFSRWWVPKQYLSSIVERPQRLQACSIGVGVTTSLVSKYSSAATTEPNVNFENILQREKEDNTINIIPSNSSNQFIVSLSSMRVNLSDPNKLPEYVDRVHGHEWPENLAKLCAASEETLKKGELEVPESWHPGDIYLSTGTIAAVEGALGAIQSGIDKIFSRKDTENQNAQSDVQLNTAFIGLRPPGHHCHAKEIPSGFCLINNVHVGIQYAAYKYNLTHAIILDFDLHHGDGSQDITCRLSGLVDEETDKIQDEKEKDNSTNLENHNESKTYPKLATNYSYSSPKIGYFSLHDINSYPTEPGYASASGIKDASVCLMAHDACIWNIHLEPFATEKEFDDLYNKKYIILIEKAVEWLNKERQKMEKQSDKDSNSSLPFNACVFFSAGFDASEYEDPNMQRHDVHLPTKFYSQFTFDAINMISKPFCNGKAISLLEGGYSDGAVSSGVASHLLGFRTREYVESLGNPATVVEMEKGCKSVRGGRRKTLSRAATRLQELKKNHKKQGKSKNKANDEGENEVPSWVNDGICFAKSNLFPNRKAEKHQKDEKNVLQKISANSKKNRLSTMVLRSRVKKVAGENENGPEKTASTDDANENQVNDHEVDKLINAVRDISLEENVNIK